MSVTVDRVVREALGLTPELRAFVAEKLIESLDAPDAPPLSEQWRDEVRRRCAELDRDEVQLRDADEAFARAFGSVG
jgi:hypothetical protein